MWIPGYRPQPVIEETGPGFFVPARPKPRETSPNLLQIALGARENLIGNWMESHYRSRCSAFRVLRRQIVIANSPESVRHVMVTHNDNFERKSPQMRRALEYLLGDGLFISDGATWQRRRPLVADIVHKNRVPLFGRTMEDVTLQLAERWEAHAGGDPIDVLTEMAELTAEIIARAVFGHDLGSMAAKEVIDGFTTYQGVIDNFNLGYFLGLDEGMPVRRSRRLKASVARVQGVIENVIAERMKSGVDEGSIIDALLKRRRGSPDLALDLAELRNEAATIFMAGHETTAATLTWAWYLLANAPWVEEALHAEIDRVTGGRAPTVEDVPQLAWCRAVAEETLRLYPPVPILSRQAREADEVCGVKVEPAALVLVVPWLLHRTDELWDQPNHFRPERFLEGRPLPYSYVPFAIGPRICAGLNFGLTEVILCLAILAQRFRVRPVEGRPVVPLCRLTLRPKGGLPGRIERR